MEASTLLLIERSSYDTSASNSGGKDGSTLISSVRRTLFIK